MGSFTARIYRYWNPFSYGPLLLHQVLCVRGPAARRAVHSTLCLLQKAQQFEFLNPVTEDGGFLS